MKKIFIKNRKDQKVCVTVEEPANPQGLAFLMHGRGGFKEQKHIQAIGEVFLDKNFIVVKFDTTCSLGESEGDYKDNTATGNYEDLEDVISWAKTQRWYREPFILDGHSMGGLCILLYAENYPEKVLALAPVSPVISGILSVEANKKYNLERFTNWEKTGWLKEESVSKPGIIKMLPWSHMIDKFKYDALLKANKLTMPVLLVVGEKDTSTPPEHIEKLYSVLPGKKELHIIKVAGHNLRLPEYRQELKNIFSQWIDKL